MDIKRFSDWSPHGWVLLAAVMALFTVGCKKTNSSGPNEQTLQQYFNGAGPYTLFNRALQRTHLDTLLGGTNPYTVFAVDDSAMSSAGYTTAGIDSADIGVLTGILLYHLVPGTIVSTGVDLYQEVNLATADSNYQAYLEFNNFGLFYNGIPLVSIDNKLGNGIVHRIQRMAMPPLGDVKTTIAKTPGLSDYSYILTMAVNSINFGASYNVIIPYLSGTPANPITLFVPDNKYFASQGLDSYYAILNHSGGGLSGYFSQGLFLTSDFIGENIITAGTGANFTDAPLLFSADGSTFFIGGGSGNNSLTGPYRIVQSNIIATNGIIHVIEPFNIK